VRATVLPPALRTPVRSATAVCLKGSERQ